MALEVDWIRGAEGFAGLAGEWDALLPADAQPFDLHCWLRAWWNAFGGSSELVVCTVRRGGALVGAMPLRRKGRRLLGLVNGHSPLCRPLAVDRTAMEALSGAITEAAGGGLEVLGVPSADSSVERLESAAQAKSRLSLVTPTFAMPFIDTSGDYETWRKENKHRWKAPLERKWRKMERDYDAVFTVVEAPANLEAELDEGLRIEASGWKGEGGTAIESAADTASFYRAMARDFQQRDQLRFNWIVLDGVAVSFDFCLLYRNRLYTLKSGYDEAYRKLAPGFVLRLAVIKRCFELGIETHELLGDESGWKTRFSSGHRPYVDFRAYPRGPVGLVRYVYRTRLRPRLRGAYRRLRPARQGG